MNVEVPKKGQSWPRGSPNAEQVKEGTINALKEKFPELLQPPYQRILDKVNNNENDKKLNN